MPWHRTNGKVQAVAGIAGIALLGVFGFGQLPVEHPSVAQVEQTARIYPHRDAMPTVSEARAEQHADGITPHSGQLQITYHGGNGGVGVTTGRPNVYLIFWGSQWGASTTHDDGDVHLSGDPSNIAPRLQDFFKGVGTTNETWSGTVTQYCEGVSAGATTCPGGSAHVGYATGGAFAGIWVDTSGASPATATQDQLGNEAIAAAAHFGNTTGASNRNAQYVVVSPHGTHPDGFNAGGQFCAWHSYVSSGYGLFPFTNLPYIPDMGWQCGANFVNGGASGALDGVTVVEGHEYSETLTDQLFGGWWDANGQEDADKCAWIGLGGTGGLQNYGFSTGSFAVQGSWSNDSADCRVAHAINGVTPNNFSIAASNAGSTRQGVTATTAVRTSITAGVSMPVTLSTSGVPSGVTASFDTNPVMAGHPATLSLAVGPNVAPGSYTIQVTGTGSNGLSTITKSVNVVLPVVLGRDFAMSGGSTTGRQGTTATVSIATSTSVGTAQSVVLNTGSLPSGVTATFGTNPVTSGSASVLTFHIGTNVAPGKYTVSVTGSGSSGGISETHTANAVLTVTLGKDFALTNTTVSGQQGTSPVASIVSRIVVGDPQSIALSVGTLANGVTAAFDTNPLTSGGTAHLTFTLAGNVLPGRYAIVVTGASSSGGISETHTATVTLTVTAAAHGSLRSV